MSEPDASETPDEPDEDEDQTAAPRDAEAGGESAQGDAAADLADIAAEADEAADADVSEDLLERVESADAEQLAGELSSLRMRVQALESELEDREATVEDLESKLKRTKADFQNYKKRMNERREEERQRATEDLVERLLEVRDNLERALEQDEGADIRDGIEATLRQFDQELERENVGRIVPDTGEAVDPQRHEVLLRVESDQPEGTIAEVHRPGYEMAGTVIRTAQVTVSEGGTADGDEADESASEGGTDQDGAGETADGDAGDET
jgi:molecular chaperone GrpE